MTRSEFDQWFAAHTAAFPATLERLNKSGTPGTTLRLWYDEILRHVDFGDACEVTRRMFRGEDDPVVGFAWEETPRHVSKLAAAVRHRREISLAPMATPEYLTAGRRKPTWTCTVPIRWRHVARQPTPTIEDFREVGILPRAALTIATDARAASVPLLTELAATHSLDAVMFPHRDEAGVAALQAAITRLIFVEVHRHDFGRDLLDGLTGLHAGENFAQQFGARPRRLASSGREIFRRGHWCQ